MNNRRERIENWSPIESADERDLRTLMIKTQEGDKACYEQLIRRMYQLLSKFVSNSFRRFGMADSGSQDDIVNEILLGIHVKRGTYDPTHTILPWMYAIARYKIIDYFRKHRRSVLNSVPIEDELDNLIVLESSDIGSGQDLLHLMSALPEKQRQVIQLVKLEGLSIKEAALRTGYSSSDIKITVHRAIRNLQKKVGEVASGNG